MNDKFLTAVRKMGTRKMPNREELHNIVRKKYGPTAQSIFNRHMELYGSTMTDHEVLEYIRCMDRRFLHLTYEDYEERGV